MTAGAAARGDAIPVAPILAVNFVGTLGFSVVLPFLVYLVTRLGGNAFVYGAVGATYSAFQLVGAPVLGRWSDRFGRRRVLLLSQGGTAASWAVFLVALALPVTPMLDVDSGTLGRFTVTLPLVVLFAARALDGLTGGNVSVANAYLADITSDADRAANFGRMAVAGNLGFIVGPALAGILGATPWGDYAPVTGALVISLVAFGMIAAGLRETRPCARHLIPAGKGVDKVLGNQVKDCFAGEDAQRRPPGEILRAPQVPLLLLLTVLVYLAFNFFYIAFPVYVARQLEWSLAATGSFFAVLSAAMVAVQGPVLSRASRRWSERALVLGGGVALAASFVLFTSRLVPVIYAGALAMALGNGLMWPSLSAMLSKAAPAGAQGAVQGLAGSGGAMASIVGLLAGGLLYTVAGSGVFLVAAAITAVVVGLALGIPRATAAGAAG